MSKILTEDLIEEFIVGEIEETSEMEVSEARSERTQNIVKMLEAYKDLQETKAKTVDLEEKRQFEERKLACTLAVENAKLETNWPEFLLKGLGTAVMFAGSILVDIALQERNLKFEETGHFTSTTVRQFKTNVRDWGRRLKR